MHNQLKTFLESICKNSDIKEPILEGFSLIFEGISASDIKQMSVPAYTKPVGEEPVGSYNNIINMVTPSIGASGEVSDAGRTDYKYGPADANPTRDIREETQDNDWDVKIPRLKVQHQKDVIELINKAQSHLPKGASVGKDFARAYAGLANPMVNKAITYDNTNIF